MIDFHTHIFPEQIAKKTLKSIQAVCSVEPCTDGTKNGLMQSAKEADISLSVILPVVTKPSQCTTINEFAAGIQEDTLISFGGIHPDTANYKEELSAIKKLGLKGIKLHPDYQQVYFNDIRYKRIVSYASELDLIISVHAGVDVGYPDVVHCTPLMAKEVIKETCPSKLVLAHLGGFAMWNQVEEVLVGEDIYLDTAFVFKHIKEEQFLRIVRNHGMERILFASDSPWASQSEFVRCFEKLNLTNQEKEWIGHKNAQHLLFGGCIGADR